MRAGLLLLLGTPALAHRPHDVVVAFAPAPDLLERGEAWLVQDPHDLSTLMKTEDHGAHWDFVASPLQDDDIVSGAASEELLAFLALDGTLWTSDDRGLSWVDQDPSVVVEEANVLALAGTRAVIATRDGLLVGDAGDVAGMTQALEGAGVRGVAFAADDEEHIVAVTRDPALWRSTDGGASFSLVKDGMPGGRSPWSVAELGGLVFVGTDHGVIWLDPAVATWDTCGTLPVTLGGEYANDVPVLVADPAGRLLATSGEQAIFISEDACESWTLYDAGVDVEYGGVGNAQSADESFVGLFMDGDLALVAGFQGIAWSEDGGAGWTDAHLLPEDYCKGVAISPDFPVDPTIFRAGYGGGVAWSSDGGESWSGSTVGVESAYSNDVSLAADFSSSKVVYYAGSNSPYRSDDGGATWTALDVPMERVRRFRDLGDRLYVLGEDASGAVQGRVAWSEDRGESWTLLESAAEAAEEAAPRELIASTVDGLPALLLVTDQPEALLVSTDEGESWTRVYAGEQETAAGAASWPAGEGSRLLFASASAGVILSDDGGASWSAPASPPTGRVRDFAAADDGTLFVVNREGQFWRSEDGGDTWAEAGASLGRAEFAMALAADFAGTGAILVGTQDGLFWTGDRGETWAQLPRYQRLEAGTHLLGCTRAEDGEDCTTYEDEAAGLGGGLVLSAGDRLSFTWKGDRLRVVGEATSAFTLALGGIEHGSVAVGELLTLEDAGWHDATLTATGEARVDLVEVYAPGEALDPGGDTADTGDSGGPPDSADTGGGGGETGEAKDEGCGGCSAGGRAGLGPLLLALLALGARRGIRSGRPSAPAGG